MLSDEEKEIFNNLKEYMQSEINKGYHKFIYNDLDWDFKCIDCINAIDKVLKQSKEIEELKDKNKFYNTAYNLGKTYSNKKWEDKIKAEIEELKKENLEIRDWKYVIDSPIDLDKLKELDLIKIKGKEYVSKEKIKAKIEEINKEMLNEENSLELFYRKKYCKEVLQELLEKEI